MLFIDKFFEKFPELSKKDIYLAGVSYAGKFIPNVAVELSNSKYKQQFKGIYVMNPLVDTLL
jgi:carboxypeptidase C (cathepsin A)